MLASDITSIASAITAALALLVAVWSAVVQRTHAKKSVTPHIDFVYGNSDSCPLALTMISNGIGPARVIGFHVFVDGKKVKKSALSIGLWHRASQLGDFTLPAHANEPRPGEYYAPGAKLTLVDFDPEVGLAANKIESTTRVIANFENALQRISVELSYECVYGRQFKASWAFEQ